MTDLHNHVRRRSRRSESGFTLIELLVVISILSVLAAIVIINVTGVHSTANTAACTTDAQTVQTALGEYYNANNDQYPWSATATTTLSTPTDLDPLAPYLTSTNLVGAKAACSTMTVTPASGNQLVVSGTANS